MSCFFWIVSLFVFLLLIPSECFFICFWVAATNAPGKTHSNVIVELCLFELFSSESYSYYSFIFSAFFSKHICFRGFGSFLQIRPHSHQDPRNNSAIHSNMIIFTKTSREARLVLVRATWELKVDDPESTWLLDIPYPFPWQECGKHRFVRCFSASHSQTCQYSQCLCAVIKSAGKHEDTKYCK